MFLGDFMKCIWLAIVVLLIIVELITVHLTTIWFVVSALVSLILAFYSKNFFLQVLVFLLLGIFLLITTKNTLLKLLAKYRHKKNINYLLGMKGQVVTPITKERWGEVKIEETIWKAEADINLLKNVSITVVEINKNIIKVEKSK